MRILWNHRRQQRLKTSLIFDFFIFHFCFLLLIAVFLVALILDFALSVDKSRMVDNNLKLEARSYVGEERDGAEVKRLNDNGGWLEELDASGNLLHVEGMKRDGQNQYSEKELIRLLENPEDGAYYTSIVTLTGGGRGEYLVLKMPRENVKLSVTVSDAAFVEHVIERVSLYFILWLALLLLLIFLYSSWVSRRINKPLQTLSHGLERLIEGDYGTRIAFEAEREFGQIRDTFNYMAEVIERTTTEKRKLEESKQQLLIDLSHDLNTPITSIQGFAQALYDGKAGDEEQQKRYLSYVYRKSNQVTELIRSMMELLKLEAPDYDFKLERREVGDYLREIVAGVYGEIEHKAFILQLHIPREAIYAVYDPEPLSRVLLNLISNALKYNPRGTALRIELKRAGQRAIIEVADSGVGIPEELRSIIFEPFVRGDEARSGDGGTGLGLSIARKITEKMGGTIRLQENETEATVFIIELPDSKRP